MTAQRANGDYQTPMALARQVCSYLYEVVGLRPQAVLEPTCGVGHLLEASLILGARHYLGIELNEAELLKHPFIRTELRHYRGDLTNIRPSDAVPYYKMEE